MKYFTLLFVWLLSANTIHAKIWRVNNNAGVVADFNTLAAAVNAASPGDTIYLEASAASYGGAGLAKRLVFIGAGYFLSGANSNPGLQAATESAVIGNISLDSLATGSVFMGLAGLSFTNQNGAGFGADDITVTRCQLNNVSVYWGNQAGIIAHNWNINKCYVGSISNIAIMQNWNFSNNIVTGTLDMPNPANANLVIRNNVFRGFVTIYNGYFANNIIYSTVSFTNVVVKNNLAIANPGGFASYVGVNGNSSGHTDAQVFQGLTGNSTDGQWRLAASSPALGAGLTVGSVVNPDAGAFGGPDPYRLSGIPSIPTIYTLTVPSSVPSGSNTMNISFSSRNNN